jgi:CBS domain-containing protein
MGCSAVLASCLHFYPMEDLTMDVRQIMTSSPACCAPDTPLPEVARMMIRHDCGEIPVLESRTQKPIGVITDRDITVRSVAQGINPLNLTARDCMTSPVVTVEPKDSLDECARTMEEKQLRRVLVVDDEGCVCGIVSQADIARNAPKQVVAEVVKDVSRRSPAPLAAM